MKATAYPSLFNPLYVIVTGSLGVFIALTLFTWNYPAPGDTKGQVFVATNAFAVWVFLLAVLCCLLTVMIIPAWGMLIGLFRNRISAEGADLRRRAIVVLSLESVFLAIVVFSVLQLIDSFRTGFQFEDYVPRGHGERMTFMYAYAFLTTLPALLGMALIHILARHLSEKIESAGRTESQLFPLIAELLPCRTLLQNYLTIVGIILSLIPITTAGLRTILIALDPQNEQSFPITNAILFGLVFTIFLLLVYVPAHLALTETSRKLRDRLCPLDSLATLKEDMEQRKALDDLLQTNIGIAQNLKAGFITLSPLIASLIAGVLGINISLP